jgi:hypothetical protein
MRTYGRVNSVSTEPFILGQSVLGQGMLGAGNPNGYVWVEVQTDANGFNDYVYITALIQCLKLQQGESPFWADWGIPARQSVVTQVFPDYYVTLMQQRFSQYFASLQITKIQSSTPTYNIALITHQGVVYNETIAV